MANPDGMSTVSFLVPKEVAKQIKAICDREVVSTKTVFLRGFQAALDHNYEDECYKIVEEVFE